MDDSNSDLLSEKYWRTLGACVYQMVSDGLQKTHEFKSLIEFYGRERLLEEYNKEKKGMKKILVKQFKKYSIGI